MFGSMAEALGGLFNGQSPMAAQGGGQGFMAGLKGHLGNIFGGGQPAGLPGAPQMPGVQMGGQQINVPGQAWGFGNEAGAVHQAVQPQMQGMMPPNIPDPSRMSPEMMMALGRALQGGGQQQPRAPSMGGGGFNGGNGFNPSALNSAQQYGMQGQGDPYQRMQARSLAQSRLGMGVR